VLFRSDRRRHRRCLFRAHVTAPSRAFPVAAAKVWRCCQSLEQSATIDHISTVIACVQTGTQDGAVQSFFRRTLTTLWHYKGPAVFLKTKRRAECQRIFVLMMMMTNAGHRDAEFTAKEVYNVLWDDILGSKWPKPGKTCKLFSRRTRNRTE